MVTINEEEFLAHYGVLRKSGRYPWGSGGLDTPEKSRSFLDWLKSFRAAGMSDAQIAEGVGMKTPQLRAMNSIARNMIKQHQINEAQRLHDKGMSNVAAARQMGIPEGTFRALLKPGASDQSDLLTATAASLREQVGENNLIDIGKGVENYLGVSKQRKDTAVSILVEEGYTVHYMKTPQIGTGKDTRRKILAAPGTTSKEVWDRRDEITGPTKVSDDGGRTHYGIKPPLPVDPARIAVRYGPDGGSVQDGVMYVRSGVEDLSMGGSRYAQVRVQVGDTHYLKGMAVYSNDLPPGVDILFNTNKKDTGNKLDAMKPLTGDPDNPFGAQLKRQVLDKDDNLTSALNIVNEEGDWNGWSRTIASQVLSKQNPVLAKTQLNLTYTDRKAALDEIMALTNPTVRRKLLEEFAGAADSASVHLAAAQLPRQRWQVILPINSLSPTEVYAPNFRDGEEVVLIRYPHGGTFEIPRLKVNNRHPEAKAIFGDAQDAVGINVAVAERLSGADFDGDTVLVIPNNQGRIQTTSPLDGLRGYDPKSTHPPYDGMTTIDGGKWDAATNSVDYGGRRPNGARKQQEMGNVSNLITDMTIMQASHAEIARAVRHSMVVIDAEKHSLDFRQSAIDNNIRELKARYQSVPGRQGQGAATIISRAKSPERVPERKDRLASEGGPIDPVTGRRMYTPTGASYVNKAGEVVFRTTKTTKLAEADDAHTLSSGTPIEKVYADHSNKLKELANQARLAASNTPRAKYDPSAARAYSKEVASLNAALDLALRAAPLERNAQTLAHAVVRAKKESNPNMDPETEKKISYQALEQARIRTGAKKARIVISQSEWDAIQAGAISDSRLTQILTNADMEQVRKLATPRTPTVMTTAKRQRAAAMLASGYTRAEIADALGVSLATLYRSFTEEET